MFNQRKIGQEFYHHSSDNPFLEKSQLRYARITHIEKGRFSRTKYVKYNIYAEWSELRGQDTAEMREFELLYPHQRGS